MGRYKLVLLLPELSWVCKTQKVTLVSELVNLVVMRMQEMHLLKVMRQTCCLIVAGQVVIYDYCF